MSLRRYEILLPQRYNDGAPVEEEKFLQTWRELVNRFGGITIELSPIKGYWKSQDKIYEDQLIRLVLDVQDTWSNRRFMRTYKQTLKERFRQIDLWVTSHRIDVL